MPKNLMGKYLYVYENIREYWCHDCFQLRLSFRQPVTHCGNCGSRNLIIAKPGTLDKIALIEQAKRTLDERG